MVRHSCHDIKGSSNDLGDSNRKLNKSGMVNDKGWFSLETESDRSHNQKRRTCRSRKQKQKN